MKPTLGKVDETEGILLEQKFYPFRTLPAGLLLLLPLERNFTDENAGFLCHEASVNVLRGVPDDHAAAVAPVSALKRVWDYRTREDTMDPFGVW